MRALKKQSKYNLALFLLGSLFIANQAMAGTDREAQEMLLKARVKTLEEQTDHSAHFNTPEKILEFHGVFYGYLPCKDCDGIKATLSLKQNDNYLLVTQPAKESSKEFYEKGKYSWNDKDQTVVLTPRAGSTTRYYRIENEGTLIQMNDNGTRMVNQSDRYTLKRSDMAKSREVHIH
jgi:uncharacterized lipoprotein NlpE involved in copper resistance